MSWEPWLAATIAGIWLGGWIFSEVRGLWHRLSSPQVRHCIERRMFEGIEK
jgi:hypothetical protein